MQVKMASAFARASATASTRSIDPSAPHTWEFSGFSQHGEDGILDYLCSKLLSRNLYFVEIGSADGLENCSAWLAFARNYGGVMVEGSSELSAKCQQLLGGRVWNIQAIPCMVNVENVEALMKTCPYEDPDVFIIDIDGMDYHVLNRVLELNYRPKIIVVEYNSAFGPDQALTVPYQAEFARWNAHPTGLYYGVSIAAWSKLLGNHGYQFLTVEMSGTNGFFIDPGAFPNGFASGIQGTAFLENIGDLNAATRPYRDGKGDLVVPKRNWADQIKKIAEMPLVKV